MEEALQIDWFCKSFNELSNIELYAILQARNEVFILEQCCPYQDIDGKDQASLHLCAWHNKVLVAYCRLLPPGLSYKEASIGRVLCKARYRRTGLGIILIEKAVQTIEQQFKQKHIKISAQLYLKSFYEKFGFRQCSEPYLEDEIPHIKMSL